MAAERGLNSMLWFSNKPNPDKVKSQNRFGRTWPGGQNNQMDKPMTEGPGRYKQDMSGRRWSTVLIFLLLVGFAGLGIWFVMTQQKPETSYDLASSDDGHPALAPLEEAVVLDKAPISDAEAVADGTLSRFDNDRWLESGSFVGTDKAGRTATLRIYLLGEDYSWIFGDGQNLTGPDGPADLPALFAGRGFLDRFCSADSILAIGTSSFEGPQALNHRLARQRGQRLVGILSDKMNVCSAGGPALLAASLGEHAETSPCPGRERCPEATSSQRRLILVGVEAASDENGRINYDEALWSGMRQFAAEQEDFFRDFRLADYDQFELVD